MSQSGPSGRTCATCGAQEAAHVFTPSGWALGHVFAVRDGDEWCDDCDDWVCNGCGSEAECEYFARENARERKEMKQ